MKKIPAPASAEAGIFVYKKTGKEYKTMLQTLPMLSFYLPVKT